MFYKNVNNNKLFLVLNLIILNLFSMKIKNLDENLLKYVNTNLLIMPYFNNKNKIINNVIIIEKALLSKIYFNLKIENNYNKENLEIDKQIKIINLNEKIEKLMKHYFEDYYDIYNNNISLNIENTNQSNIEIINEILKLFNNGYDNLPDEQKENLDYLLKGITYLNKTDEELIAEERKKIILEEKFGYAKNDFIFNDKKISPDGSINFNNEKLELLLQLRFIYKNQIKKGNDLLSHRKFKELLKNNFYGYGDDGKNLNNLKKFIDKNISKINDLKNGDNFLEMPKDVYPSILTQDEAKDLIKYKI